MGLLGVLAVYVAIFLFGPDRSATFDSWRGYLAGAAEIVALVACYFAARRHQGRQRAAWLLIGLGIFGGLVGHTYVAVAGGDDGSVAAFVSDGIGLSAYAAMIAGIALLMAWRFSAEDLPRLIDLLIVSVATLTLVYQHVVLDSATGATDASVIASLYLVGSIAVVYLIGVSGNLRRPTGSALALTLGALFVVIGNAVYLHEVVGHGRVMRGPEGAFWSMALLLAAFASVRWTALRRSPEQSSNSVRSLLLPVCAGLLVSFEEAVAAVNGTQSWQLGLCLTILFALIVLRLIATAHESVRRQVRAEQLASQQQSLLIAAQAVGSTLDLEIVIERVVRELGKLLGISGVAFADVRADGSTLIRQGFGPTSAVVGNVIAPGEGLAGLIVMSGETVVCDGDRWRGNITDKELRRSLPEFAQLLGVPVKLHGRIRGVLFAGTLDPEYRFDDDRVRMAEALGEMASVAVDNADTIAEVRKRAAESQALRLATADIAAQRDVDEIMGRLARDGRALLSADAGLIAYVDDLGHTRWRHGSGLDSSNWADYDNEPGVGLAARAVNEDQPITISGIGMHPDYTASAFPFLHREGMVSAIGAPIKAADGSPAALIIAYRKLHQFTPDEVALVEGLAKHGAVALETARLIENRDQTTRELSRRLEATIGALANAIAAEDGYTSDHSRSVVQLASAVGERMGLSPRQVAEVQTVAELHDVGKIGVPNEILNKDGALSSDEWQVMREHPVVGERILTGIPGLESVAVAVRHEHEHYDGSGYPDRLSGDEIPLASRIVLVCDAYHAMTSNRPYRKAMARKEAVEELARNAKSQFDPAVLSALFEVLGERRSLAVLGVLYPEQASRAGSSVG